MRPNGPFTLLQQTCAQSLDTGHFIDTKFYVYSRRSRKGIIHTPKAVYASSEALRSINNDYLNALLGGSFGGGYVVAPLNSNVPASEGCSHLDKGHSREYDSDSDIDNDEDDNDENEGDENDNDCMLGESCAPPSLASLTLNQAETPYTTSLETEAALDGPGMSHRLEDGPVVQVEVPQEEDQENPSLECKIASLPNEVELVAEAPFREDDAVENIGRALDAEIAQVDVAQYKDQESTLRNIGRIIVLRGFAYSTWKALIYYLYTGRVSFSPLQSQLPTSTRMRRKFSLGPPSRSPKSMYKLADELGMTGLKELARKDILSKLSANNLIDELFSTFTLSFDAIRDMEISYACSNTQHVIHSDLPIWLNETPAEHIKRHANTLGCLIRQLSSAQRPNYGWPDSAPTSPTKTSYTVVDSELRSEWP